jgi:hypothetical protein
LLATAYDGSGNVVPGVVVTWGSSSPAVATVDQSGNVTGVGVGTSTITAAAAGQLGRAVTVVSQPPVATVAIVPDTLTLAPGNSSQLAATAYDAAGHVLTGLSVTWGTTNAAVASVSSSGSVTGVAPGTTSVSAAIGGRSASATVTVLEPPPVLIAGCSGGTLSEITAAPIIVTSSIDNQCQATLQSTAGSIEIRGQVNHGSSATLVAATGVAIDDQINGGSVVQVTAGGAFTVVNGVGGHLAGPPGPGAPPGGASSALTVFDSDTLSVGGDIHDGAQAKLHSRGPIQIGGAVHDPGTVVLWWAPSLAVRGGIGPGAQVVKQNWGGFSDEY